MQQMPNNPYAAPVAAAGPGAPAGMGQARDWEIGEVLTQAWETFKQQWAVLVFAPFVLFVIYIVAAVVLQLPLQLLAREDATLGMVAAFPVMLLQMFVMSFVYAGCIKLFVAAARGQTPEFGVAFSGIGRALPLLLGQLLVALAYLFGFILLVVPGIIVGLGTAFTMFYVADMELGPIDAFKRSWETMKGHKMKLFLYGLVSFGIALLGYIACLVGIFVAMPVIMLGMAIIYTRISGTASGPSGGSGFAVPQQGTYGSPPGAPAYAAPGGGYPPAGGGYGGPGGQNPPGGGYGAPPGGGYNPPGGGGYNPPGGGGGYGPPGGGGYNPPGGGGGYNPPGGGGGYGPPGGGGGYNPPGGGGGYGPPGGGGYNPPGGGGYGPPGGGGYPGR